MTREEAYGLLKEYVEKESLIKHCVAVQAAMVELARVLQGDEERWGVVGILHDIDYTFNKTS